MAQSGEFQNSRTPASSKLTTPINYSSETWQKSRRLDRRASRKRNNYWTEKSTFSRRDSLHRHVSGDRSSRAIFDRVTASEGGGKEGISYECSELPKAFHATSEIESGGGQDLAPQKPSSLAAPCLLYQKYGREVEMSWRSLMSTQSVCQSWIATALSFWRLHALAR